MSCTLKNKDGMCGPTVFSISPSNDMGFFFLHLWDHKDSAHIFVAISHLVCFFVNDLWLILYAKILGKNLMMRCCGLLL